MTLEDLRTEVWDRLGEDPDDPQRYTSADVLEYLNDGAQALSARAGLQFGETQIVQRPGQLFYALPDDLIHVTRVKLYIDAVTAVGVTVGAVPDGAYDLDANFSADEMVAYLEPVHHRELDADTYKWTIREGRQATHYGIFGLNEIFLWPLIGSGTKTYSVEYLQDLGEDDLSADTDEPTLPDQFHEAVIDYAVARCLLVDGEVADAQTAYQAYEAVLSQARRRKAGIQREWGLRGGRGLR